MAKEHVNEKILNFLKNNPRYSYNAPTIYKHFKGGINITSIRCELRRLHESKKILRETHGFYRINISAETLHYIENPPTLLHGVMVSMRWHGIMQKDIHGITFENLENDIKDRLESLGYKVPSGLTRNKKRLSHSFYYDNDVDRRVTITVHFNGRLDVYLNCSSHPVNYFEFRDILNYVKGGIDFLGPFSDQRVVQFGLAKDFREVRMEGASCVTLRAFMDSWFRVYNKENGTTRIEQHINCNLPVSEFVNLFERMFLPVGNGFSSRPDEGRDVV